MLEQNYSKWLVKEVVAAKYALVVALEKRDNLLYIEEPALKEEYMQKIGVYEEQVLKLELEVTLQEKKKQMIQAAINRREEIDLEEIDKELEKERANQLLQLNETYAPTEKEDETLTAEEKDELQRLYKETVREFHPEVRKDMTELQKDLYQKALEAYKRKNLEQLRLIHDMLFYSDSEGLQLEVSTCESETSELEEIREIAKSLMEDYTLAAKLYPYFEPLQEDATLFNTKVLYENKQAVVLAEIDHMAGRFPFVAKDTLRDEAKLKEYVDSLNGRMNSAKTELADLQSEITEMIGA